MTHGLGINSTMTVKNNTGKWGGSISGKACIYDTFLCNKEGNQLINETYYKNNSEILATVLTSDEVYWNGSNAIAASEDNVVKIYAPKEWSESSICHLDTKYGRTINDLMAYGNGGVTSNNWMDNMYTFNPGPIVLGMLQDIGWTVNANPTANENIEYSSTIVKVYAANNQIVIEGAESSDRVMISNFSGRLIYSGVGNLNINLPSGLYIVKVGDQSFKIQL